MDVWETLYRRDGTLHLLLEFFMILCDPLLHPHLTMSWQADETSATFVSSPTANQVNYRVCVCVRERNLTERHIKERESA